MKESINLEGGDNMVVILGYSFALSDMFLFFLILNTLFLAIFVIFLLWFKKWLEKIFEEEKKIELAIKPKKKKR